MIVDFIHNECNCFMFFLTFFILSCIAICLLSCSFFYLLLESHQRFIENVNIAVVDQWIKKASSRVDDIDYLWKYVLRTLQKRLSKGKLKHIFWLFRSHVTFLGGLNINLWGVCCEKKNFHLKLIKKQRKKWFPAVKSILSKNKTREMKNIFPLHSFDIKRDAFAW